MQTLYWAHSPLLHLSTNCVATLLEQKAHNNQNKAAYLSNEKDN